MIINHKRKFVFVCVPKTSSTTLSKHFIKVDNLSVEKSWLKVRWHWPIKDIQKTYDVKDYYTFAYHRNPWDRMISSWIEFTEDQGHLMTWSQPMKDQFTDFEDFITNFRETKWAQDIHFRPTVWYTHVNSKQVVDHIAKYNDWYNETSNIFKKIDLDISQMESKRYRATNRNKDYKSYYTNDKMIEQVQKHFAADIETFGDTF